MRKKPHTLGAAWLLLAVALVGFACADGTTSIPIEPETGTIIGRVVDSNRTPLAGALIHTTSAPSVMTDATGHFTIADLPLEAEYLVTAVKAGYVSSSVEVPVTEAQPLISIELTLARLGG
ncbi:MAG: carboxypeptidase-like regulatory domain-containing protein [Gemmatimonadota bacterium]